MNIVDRIHRLNFFQTHLNLSDDEWFSSKILDYGGNRGNVLEDLKDKYPGKKFNYTCADVDDEAVDFGRKHHPEYEWIQTHSYNQVYNPLGSHNYVLPFEDNTFDYILAYSVHSHTTYEQLLYDLKDLVRILKPGGKLITSLTTYESVDFFLRKRYADFGSAPSKEKFSDITDYLYYVNHDIVTKEFELKPVNFFVTFYNVDWLINDLTDKGYNLSYHSKSKPFMKFFDQKALVVEK